jgi:predicted GNAT family acetyltransferase
MRTAANIRYVSRIAIRELAYGIDLHFGVAFVDRNPVADRHCHVVDLHCQQNKSAATADKAVEKRSSIWCNRIMMEIQRDEHGRKGAFYIDEDGEWIAELTYSKNGNTMTIDHTEIDEKLRGEGIGQDMVKAAVEYARENGLKIKPVCPYARKIIESTPEFQDVLAPLQN